MSRTLQSKWILFILCPLIIAFGYYIFFETKTYLPLYHIEPDEAPEFLDDMSYHSLLPAAQEHAAYLRGKVNHKFTTLDEVTYSTEWLLESLHELMEKINENPSPDELQNFILANYDIYQAGGREDRKRRQMLVTGYYEPLFDGSLTKIEPYVYPLYSPPDDLVKQESKDENQARIGKITDNKFTSYWTRAEIETRNIAKGYELAYLKDPFDAFLLHVQGSGRIKLRDNSIRAIRFASSNGLEYNSIGKLLVDQKKIPLEEVTVPAIRDYLRQHPEQLQQTLHHNPRFIFFNWGDNRGPRGSSGAVLTPGRSIAIDNLTLPDGAIAYLSTKKPVINQQGEIIDWTELNRFVFPQDSGAAIKGAGRVDLFWGYGNYAELAASHMKENGKLYFLVKKQN